MNHNSQFKILVKKGIMLTRKEQNKEVSSFYLIWFV
jgi:hypothetical protein